jgi:hypothetical protein
MSDSLCDMADIITKDDVKDFNDARVLVRKAREQFEGAIQSRSINDKIDQALKNLLEAEAKLEQFRKKFIS